MHKIGIDLGGTKTEGVLLDENNNLIERNRKPTPKQDYQKILDVIVEMVTQFKTQTKNASIGVCTPGTISKHTGLIKNSNTQCLIGMPLKQDLESILNSKILMENDANCFALAEATMGAVKDFDVVFGIIMGTGVGGGIVINGQIYHGRTNIAGEWGHHILHPNGNKCYCGNSGCTETYISGPALEKRWNELTGKSELLPSIIQNTNDEKFKQWKNEFLENFGTSLANVIDILDPDAIVLGGGVSNISFLYDDGQNAVYDKVFSDLVETPILPNKLGDSAGVFGACLLAQS